jgi:hypothetical protein
MSLRRLLLRRQTVPACVRACAQYDDSAREINTTRAKHASFPQNTHHAQSVKAIQIRWPDMRLFGKRHVSTRLLVN